MKLFKNKYYLLVEFVLLFFGIPIFIMVGTNIIHPSRLLLPVILIILVYLYKSPHIQFKEFFHFRISRKKVFKNLVIFFLVAILLTSYVYIFERKNLFNLPSENTRIWLLLFFFYPVFSASFQEIIYRIFLFNRYEKLFKKPEWLILASGITFSFVHILYYSLLSVILTLVLGIYLAYIYNKTKSLLFTSIIHGIYGNLVFTIGLGHYFWLDMHKYL